MKTKTITADVVYKSNEDCYENPEFIKIKINTQMMAAIKKARKLLKENKEFNCIKIDACADLLDNDEKESNFRPACESLLVYEGSGVYYTAQSKYDSATYFESDDLYL